MKVCEACQQTILHGSLAEVYIVANGELWYLGKLASPPRNWRSCKQCQRVVCDACCACPESGYCKSCFAAEYDEVQRAKEVQ